MGLFYLTRDTLTRVSVYRNKAIIGDTGLVPANEGLKLLCGARFSRIKNKRKTSFRVQVQGTI